jgi:hypothetical protein
MISNERSFLILDLLYNTDCAHRCAVTKGKLKEHTEKAWTYVYVVNTEYNIDGVQTLVHYEVMQHLHKRTKDIAQIIQVPGEAYTRTRTRRVIQSLGPDHVT